MQGFVAVVFLFGTIAVHAQVAGRLTSTAWVRDGRTFLCRYQLVSRGEPDEHQYALRCNYSPTMDDDFGLACFPALEVAVADRPSLG